MLMILCWITFIVSMTTLQRLGTFQKPFYLAANLQLLTASFIHHPVMPCLSDLPSPPPILTLLSRPISNLVCIIGPHSAPQLFPTARASSTASSLTSFLTTNSEALWLFFLLQLFSSLFSVFCNAEHTQGTQGMFVVILKFSEPLDIDHLCS